MAWEHRIIDDKTDRMMEKALDEASNDGWELVSWQAVGEPQPEGNIPRVKYRYLALLRRSS